MTTQRYIWEIEAGKPSIFVDRLFGMMRETGVELTATIIPAEPLDPSGSPVSRGAVDGEGDGDGKIDGKVKDRG